MKRRHFKFLLLTIPFSILVSNHIYGQDLFDAIKNNSKLVIELKDTYRAFHINNIISDQKEMINLFLNDGSDAEMKTLLESYLKACDSLKITHFNNDSLNLYVSRYITSTSQSYKIAKSKGFNSLEFEKDFEKYKKTGSEYMSYLYSTYSTDHFINMTEEKYWQTINKKNYIDTSVYAAYQTMKKVNLKDAISLLDQTSKLTVDFQKRSIYQIELADQYVKHSDSLGENANEIAIEKYKAILDEKKYSIYLFEAWLKWRMVTQQHIYGISKSSDIPNKEYDKVREQVALTILDYITKNDQDEMAINEFLLMATHNIVKRFGDYPYGNQNTVEYHETFDEEK